MDDSVVPENNESVRDMADIASAYDIDITQTRYGKILVTVCSTMVLGHVTVSHLFNIIANNIQHWFEIYF